MIKFLKDSYNGLFVVLLKPYMPRGKTLAVLVGGVGPGLGQLVARDTFWAATNVASLISAGCAMPLEITTSLRWLGPRVGGPPACRPPRLDS